MPLTSPAVRTCDCMSGSSIPVFTKLSDRPIDECGKRFRQAIACPPKQVGSYERRSHGELPRHHVRNTIGSTLQHWCESHSIACRSEEHTSELQSLMRISYAVFCLKKKNKINKITIKKQ